MTPGRLGRHRNGLRRRPRRREFGERFALDVGMLRTKHAQLLNGLWPIMSVRDRAKPGTPGTVELRLVAGPLPNAAHAARLCAAFAGLGVACQPAVFDGQRLALR